MTLLITSAAFTQGHPIPKKYTGEGVDVSPPLSWSGLPEGTKELALVCDDPDAPQEDHHPRVQVAKGHGRTRECALSAPGSPSG